MKVSKYALPGTQELADSVCAALGARGAALIRNHGAVSVGRDLSEALHASSMVERVAQVFVCTSLLGKVNTLPKGAMDMEFAICQMRRQVEL